MPACTMASSWDTAFLGTLASRLTSLHTHNVRGDELQVVGNLHGHTDVGSVLTVWGAALPWLSQLPCLTVLAMLWTALYIVTAVQEQFF